MANKKITDLTELTAAASNDYLEIVDTSANTSKKISYGNLIDANAGTWQSYTVSWTAATTNPSIGNGTLVGRYTQIGKTCILIIGLTMGSTTTYGSGNWSFSLPKTAKNTTGIVFYGVAHIRNTGTANYERIAQISPVISTTVIKLFNDPTQGSNSSNISATVPFTWGDGDALGIEITYEME